MQTATHRAIWRPLWQLPSRAELIFSFAKRELVGRYKGSVLGIAWAVLTPVVMIAIFTFIFAGIFGARFGATILTGITRFISSAACCRGPCFRNRCSNPQTRSWSTPISLSELSFRSRLCRRRRC